MNPTQGILSGTCGAFNSFQQTQSAPNRSCGFGNPITKYPYGTTLVKYFPSGSSSVGRSMWDGWRYGSGYIGPNPGKVYGEPDYKYYAQNYCNPCGCFLPEGSMKDPNGENPNIRYVQLDYKNLLGSGFAQQGQSATSQLKMGTGSLPPTSTSCGRDHCTHYSGVFKKAEQPVKFQVCIGDPECPETMQPCLQQHLKVYQSNQMLPQYQNQSESGGGDCEDGNRNPEQEVKLPDYEIQIPGHTDRISDVNEANGTSRKKYDDCGNCKACKNVSKLKASSSSSCLVRSPQLKKAAPRMDSCDTKEYNIYGQMYTTGPVPILF